MAHGYSPVQLFDIKVYFVLSLFAYICCCICLYIWNETVNPMMACYNILYSQTVINHD